LVPLVALVIGACGGGDEADPDQVVRDFVTATDAKDAERLCEEILTRAYISQATGAEEGDTGSCKRQLAAVEGLDLALVRIVRTTEDGDKAEVRAVIRLQGQRQRRIFRLEREDGDWKVAGGTAG